MVIYKPVLLILPFDYAQGESVVVIQHSQTAIANSIFG